MEEQSTERSLEEGEVKPHVIRLRGRWDFEPLARTVLLADGTTRSEPGTLPPAGRAQLPADWDELLGNDFRGRVRFGRHFNCPTGLTSRHQVTLTIEEVDAFGDAKLNDRSLGALAHARSPYRFEITSKLKQRNDLVVEIELPRLTKESASLERPKESNLSGGWIGEVRLEILEEVLKPDDHV